jgi:hypothetical protein
MSVGPPSLQALEARLAETIDLAQSLYQHAGHPKGPLRLPRSLAVEPELDVCLVVQRRMLPRQRLANPSSFPHQRITRTMRTSVMVKRMSGRQLWTLCSANRTLTTHLQQPPPPPPPPHLLPTIHTITRSRQTLRRGAPLIFTRCWDYLPHPPPTQLPLVLRTLPLHLLPSPPHLISPLTASSS